MFPYIVADIGGTNARFALVTGKQGPQFTLEHVNILAGADYLHFEDAVQVYIDSLGGIVPTAACLAIAAPIGGDWVKMTNLPWAFSKLAVQKRFGFEAFDVINDFTAVALSTSRLSSEDVVPIRPGQAVGGATKAVLGAGTGLGVAALVNAGDRWLPIPSEGGHVNIAPATSFEADVIKAGMQRFGHVSAEIFISGPGLVNLYHSICDVEGAQALVLAPHEITAQALAGENTVCVTTLTTFCSLAGTLAGNVALTYGARGGVYLAGGVMPRLVDFLKASAFSERFASKGVMSHFVETIPVNLITYNQIAFLGAAAWLDQLVSP